MSLTLDKISKLTFSTSENDTIEVNIDENLVIFTDPLDPLPYTTSWYNIVDLVYTVEYMLNTEPNQNLRDICNIWEA